MSYNVNNKAKHEVLFMKYNLQLKFLRDFLCALHISSSIISNPSEKISSEVDLGLRAFLFETDNYNTILENSLSSAKEKTIYRFFDEYNCKYIFLKLPNCKDDTYFFIGPYLLEMLDYDYLTRKAETLALSESQKRQLELYYNSLPVIEDENYLLTLANTFGATIWGKESQFEMEYVEYEIPDRSTPIPVSPDYSEQHRTQITLSVLEANYEKEKQLMKAVSQGNLHLVTAVASSVYNNGTEQRLPDSLRDRKNYLIILKTLLRKAAEHGNVHPLHIHRLTSKYSKRIEETRSLKESLQLQENMIRDYCILVNKHSLSHYSYYVGKAITIINYDLTADLSLHSISSQLNVNSSYLSNLFHKECNCTLTEYVNRKRITHAVSMLKNTDKLIQDIASDCGFQDTTYFIRLFKKQFGCTPLQYRGNCI